MKDKERCRFVSEREKWGLEKPEGDSEGQDFPIRERDR